MSGKNMAGSRNIPNNVVLIGDFRDLEDRLETPIKYSLGKHIDYIDETNEIPIYRDEGCDLHPSCLKCPLPQCRYDVAPGIARSNRNVLLYIELQKQGLDLMEIAQELNVSKRTVQRLRNQAKKLA